MKKLDQQKLEELHAHIQSTPDINRKGISEFIGGEDPEPWVIALQEKYPDKYIADDEPAPKKKAGRPPATPKEEAQPTEYFLVKDGIKQPLALKGTKGNQVILETIEPKELVEVIIKGEPVTIDLLKLEQESAKLGVPVGQLQILGDMAKL